VILVALAVLASTAAGAYLERHIPNARALAGGLLLAMLYVLVPFISYVSFAHLRLSADAGAALALAWCGVLLAGLLGWLIGRRFGYDNPTIGAIVCGIMLVNTGYLGDPVASALLGSHQLVHAVAYDQALTGPAVFTIGFTVGGVFGTRGETPTWGARLKRFLFRNPPLWGLVAGLLVPKSWAPHVLVSASHLVVDSTLVLGFLAVGVFLSAEREEDHVPMLERPDRRVWLAIVMRFCVNPGLLGLAALAGLKVPIAFVLQAAMPSGVTGLIIGYAYGLDQRLIASIIVWTTLIAVAVTTVIYFA
jgi:hypothetical protein